MTIENQKVMIGSSDVPRKIVPYLRGACGGDVRSIAPYLIQLHRTGFNLEFETLL